MPYTGEVDTVLVPCGHTLAHVCPSCAERARTLRAAQCREGWHLEDEPAIAPDPATGDQKWWVEKRAEAQQLRDQADVAGQDTTDLDELLTELDEEITKAGVRGKVASAKPARRHRSTWRRQDAPDLPRRKVSPRTVGKTYTTPDGKTFRPSLFVTLTCPSYGRVSEDGTPADPADPADYDYDRAARDALTFAALFDRFIQNLRRYLGYDVQYFAAIEPQKRSPRTSTSLSAAPFPAPSCAGSWPPPTTRSGGPTPPRSGTTATSCPCGKRPSAATSTRLRGRCCRPGTRRSMRSGTRMSRGMWPGSGSGSTPMACWPDRGRGAVHQVPDQVPHQASRRLPPGRHRRAARPRGAAGRGAAYQPCSPRCANWLRYGIQPKNARPGPAPGRCKGKAHDADHRGYAGRRVLVSRKWSGKTLADHRADRRDWLLSTLGVSATDPARYAWEPVAPTDPDHMDHARRLLHAVADRARWQAALAEARRRAADGEHLVNVPATGKVA
jgi:hypothetical protein